MKRIYTFLAAIMFATLMYADPIPGCIEPDSIVYQDSLCSSKDIFELRHEGQLIRTFTPQVPGIFTLADTVKGAVSDSLIVKWIVTVLPTYVIEMDPVYVPVGKTSFIWEQDGQEHMGGDVVADSLVTVDGCDSVQIYRFIKETPSGYCGAEGDGTNLQWFISEDSVLHITGQGTMANYYEYSKTAPWDVYKDVIKEVIFPDELTSIGSEAFYKCSILQSVSIPANVNSIGSNAFGDCMELSYVNTPDLQAWCNINFSDTASNPTCKSHKLYLNGAHIQHLIVPGTVTTIKAYAFYHCDFKKVTLHANISSLVCGAFDQCDQLDTMICHATIPPTLPCGAPGWLSAVLCVPYTSVDAYKTIEGYALAFKEIIGFSNVRDTTATTATLAWISDPSVTQYTISIYTSDTLFAQYIVDEAGNVIDTLKAAPKIAQMPKKKLDSRETFTISIGGLTPGSSYTYTIVGTNIEQQPVYYEEGSFQTADEGKGIDVISSDPDKPRKILYEGKIYILRNGKTYDLLGR